MADTTYKQAKGMPNVELIRKVYKGIVMFENEIEEIETMDIKKDDIWICSYPRSGTTMAQELVYVVATLDFDTAKSVQLNVRFPIVEIKDDRFPYYKGLKYVNSMPSPRFIKSHLHHFLLPQQLQNGKGKLIYMARNPKDVVCSLYRLEVWLGQLPENTFEEFFDTFVNGTGYACPWPRHVLEYWERRNDGQVLFLKYEDVVNDMPGAARQIAAFLGKTLTNKDVDKICKHCHVDSMRTNDMVNMSYYKDIKRLNETAKGRFINKGKTGEWRGVLSPDQSSRIDKMLEELDGSGLHFESE